MTTYTTPFGSALFTKREARALGLTDDDLRVAVARGGLRRVLRGVYVDASVPLDLDVRARAVARVIPEGDVVCLRTAAWLWGVDALAMGSHRVLPTVDVMAPSGSAGPRRTDCRGFTGPLSACDVVELGGVLVTTPARTAADLLRLLKRPDALAAVDAFLRETRVAPDEIADVLSRFRRARGVVQARELLSLGDGRAESPQESRTRLRCIDAGFPCPEPQIVVVDELDRFLARLDMGYRELLKALEFDGHDAHHTLVQQRHDAARRRRVERRGWQVLVVTTEHVQGKALVFEQAVGELLERAPRLTRHHPRYGGWDNGLLPAA